MRVRKTKIERLDAKHPGLEEDVCRWLKGHLTGREVSARLRDKYHETVAPNTINSYRARRVDGELKLTQKRKIEVVAFAQAIGEEGLDAGALAKLWELLQSMSPAELIELRRLQVERAHVQVLDKRAENEKSKLQALLAKLKMQQRQAADERKSDQPMSARELRRSIREIYGLPDDSAEIEDHPVPAKEAFLETVDAVYGIGEYGADAAPAQTDANQSHQSQSDVPSSESGAQNGSGLQTLGAAGSSDIPSEGRPTPSGR